MLTVARPWLLIAGLLWVPSSVWAADIERASEEKPGIARARQLRGKLAQHVTIDGFEANTPIKEAIGFLSERYDLPIVFSLELLKIDKEFENRPIKSTKFIGVRLRAILALILEQVEADMVQRDGLILIVPRDQAGAAELLRQRVELSFDQRPFAKVLEELADATGFNIVLDPRVGDKAKAPLSASLKNVPLETAVRLLADMADLKPVLLDNVFYVTTRANAALLQAEEKRHDRAPSVMPKVPEKERDAEPADEEKKP